MNSKQLNVLLGIGIAILLVIVGYMAVTDNAQKKRISQAGHGAE